jgi:hypothetical protein
MRGGRHGLPHREPMSPPCGGSAEAIPATVLGKLSFALVGQCAALHESAPGRAPADSSSAQNRQLAEVKLPFCSISENDEIDPNRTKKTRG